MALNRDAIVTAGLEILDAYGLGDLSMRRVAERLDVQPGALYYHVPNKQTMLAAISDRILGQMPLPGDQRAAGPWLRQWGHNLRDAVLRHRDGAELVASTNALGLGELDPAKAGVELLTRTGDAWPRASMAALTHFVLGHATTEQVRRQLHEMAVVEHFDSERAERDFEHGLELVIRGLVGGDAR